MSTDTTTELDNPFADSVGSTEASSSESAVEPTLPLWPLLIGAGVTGIVALAYFLYHVGPGIAFGPWQAAYLDPGFPYRYPLVSAWVARAFAVLPIYDPAWRTALASATAGALACAALAVLAGRAAQRHLGTPLAIVCGSAAGILLALTPIWLRAGTTASPAPVTVSAALIGLIFLQQASLSSTPRWLFYAGVFFGFATANDPAFALVAIIAVLAALGEMGERLAVRRIIVPLVAGFVMTGAIPYLRSFLAGEDLSEFFSHAMATAYPTIGDGAPRLGFGLELRPQFAWVVLAATLAGLIALFSKNVRGAAITWALIFLAMGPFWPSLVNQHRTPHVLRDMDAANAMAYAAVCVGAAWGLAWFANAIVSARKRPLTAVAVLALLIGNVAAVQYRVLPEPRADLAETVGRSILDDCSLGAALVAGDPHISSLLRTLQIARGVRQDVAVISVHALEQPQWRAFLHRKYAGILNIPTVFPQDSAWQRWPYERPNEFGLVNAMLKEGTLREGDFRDLMLWEFMRDNFPYRPVYFAGVTSPWLTARGKRVGFLLQYPRTQASDGHALDSLLSAAPDEHSVRQNPEFDRTIVALLLPLTEAFRRQGDVDEAEKIAQLARVYGEDDAGAWLSSARAAARGGQRERAIDYAANYIRLADEKEDMQVFLDLIEEDLLRNALAREFDALALADSPSTRDRRTQLAAELWNLDELAVLSAGYTNAMRSGGATEFDLVYETAAANVQLGNLDAGRAALQKAVSLDYRKAIARLQTDGRFFLLQVDQPQPQKPRLHG